MSLPSCGPYCILKKRFSIPIGDGLNPLPLGEVRLAKWSPPLPPRAGVLHCVPSFRRQWGSLCKCRSQSDVLSINEPFDFQSWVGRFDLRGARVVHHNPRLYNTHCFWTALIRMRDKLCPSRAKGVISGRDPVEWRRPGHDRLWEKDVGGRYCRNPASDGQDYQVGHDLVPNRPPRRSVPPFESRR